jgi:CRISPR/Cas system-associated exonuclease Cas4 (RecB family)
MNTFLHDIATRIHAEYPQLDDVTVVFPNRRAMLYFRKALSSLLTQPAFAPRLLTIEEFIAGFSGLHVPDKLELVHRLYRAYTETVQHDEPFDQFYFWGDMLLRDFDEVDKYLANAGWLFKDLSHQKELDSLFDYLTEEQRKFLLDFWGNFQGDLTINKKKFLDVWRHLGDVYQHYRNQLRAEGLAYEGMLHRAVAEDPDVLGRWEQPEQLVFAGFNALTKAEEVIIGWFTSRGSKMYWDLDEYYVNNKIQEAGEFFRQYQQHPSFRETFDAAVPANFRAPKSIRMIGAVQPIGQAKVMSQLLADQLQQGMVPEETLVVLPDEKLLMPVLHGISGSVDKLNVTMGFQLVNTPVFSLIELLVELQQRRKDDHFHHRAVLGLLNHPYGVAPDPDVAAAKRKEILSKNRVWVPVGLLASGTDLHRLIFSVDTGTPVMTYLRDVLSLIGTLDSITEFDREYIFHFVRHINRIEAVLGADFTDHQAFIRFLRQYVRSQKIPFSGEPLQGLQVMGMLETRNLDFKNVFLLSLNEGSLPSGGSKGSYIPHNIRKAYALPTVQHQDAMYAYLFYRVLQRAENIWLFYNTETDVLGQGEMSRFLQQLVYESGLPIEQTMLHNAIQPTPIHPIVIQKDEGTWDELMRINNRTGKYTGFSPSALNTYIECRLKFYFQQIMRIREPDEVEEQVDARIMGNLLHTIMERFYIQLAERKGNRLVTASDFDDLQETINQLLDEAVRKLYHLDPQKPVVYEGQLKLISAIVHRLVKQIVQRDKAYAPFVIEGVEQDLSAALPIGREPGRVVIGGIIDRLDRKENVVRIVDYKTGRDTLEFDSIESLFSREGKRNKAAFQTLVYTWMYHNRFAGSQALVPGLVNMKNLFHDDRAFGLVMKKERVEDATSLLPEFEMRLIELMEEIVNPDVPFDQTADLEICKYCPYARICYR